MAEGVTVSSISGTVVAIETDEGLIGWGEVTPWGATYLPEFTESVRVGLALICPSLIGSDPLNVAAIYRTMDAQLYGHPYIKSAVDMACWDLLGRASGQPLHALLGGKTVGAAPLNCAVYNGTYEDMAERISGYREQGIRIFSTKPSGNADLDIRLYEQIADQRLGGETYIADANRSWSVPTAMRVARNLEEYGFFNLEQPCGSYEECLAVRRATRITTALDESLVSYDDLVRTHRDGAAEIAHIKLSRVGGLSKARVIRDFCEVVGLSVSWATSGGTEICDSAATHLACSTNERSLFGLWSCREFNTEVFCDGGPEINGGQAKATDLPGLGISPDLGKLGTPITTYRRE
jgi:L-alanine-DL-glutamate epimerase-like enolase superfamily enzyme